VCAAGSEGYASVVTRHLSPLRVKCLDAVPLRKIPLNKVPFVPNNEPLLGILDKFQEGRSHIAIVSRFSVDKVCLLFVLFVFVYIISGE